mmetsp:Transcript_36083/g.66134  ORF Transcript_36083/g.66134 Transcript_36083/m.66134 type:complete len:259 (-) Transcript_36083:433-1209(-)
MTYPTMDDVFAAIGTELYTFLAPRDLFCFSLSNHHFSRDVRAKLFHICLQQLKFPASDDRAPAAASVVISNKHSFATRGEVAECLMEKIKFANLRYDPPDHIVYKDTIEETLALTKEAISDESRWSEECAWYGTFKSDPAEIWKPLKKPFSVGCRFEKELRRGRSRRCFIDWRLREMGQKDFEVNQVVRDWARYIIAQKGIVGREWQWECDGEEGVGFMIYTPEGEQLEIRLTKNATATAPDHATSHSPPSLLSAFGF